MPSKKARSTASASAGKWKKIEAPLGHGSVSFLRLQVLWIHRSSSRKFEWSSRENVTRNIPDDVDNRWNYTLRMIEVAETHKAALNDNVNEKASQHLPLLPQWP